MFVCVLGKMCHCLLCLVTVTGLKLHYIHSTVRCVTLKDPLTFREQKKIKKIKSRCHTKRSMSVLYVCQFLEHSSSFFSCLYSPPLFYPINRLLKTPREKSAIPGIDWLSPYFVTTMTQAIRALLARRHQCMSGYGMAQATPFLLAWRCCPCMCGCGEQLRYNRLAH